MMISAWQLVVIVAISAILIRGIIMPILNRPLLSFILGLAIYFVIGNYIYIENHWRPVMPVTIYISYLIAAIVCAYALLRFDEEKLKNNSATFKREGAFNNFGSIIFEYEYHFKASDWDVTRKILSALQSELSSAGSIECINNIVIVDKDRKLPKYDERVFLKVEVERTLRKGKVTQLFSTSKIGQMFGIKWWFLAAGGYDKWRVFTYLVFSPITIAFWIIPRLFGKHNIALSLKNIYPALYERFDLLNAIQALNKLTVNTLIRVLEEEGVDVSDLKTQQAQVLNIDISGGKVNFGSIVQGSMNKVVSRMGIAR